jgi:hypothetical protein
VLCAPCFARLFARLDRPFDRLDPERLALVLRVFEDCARVPLRELPLFACVRLPLRELPLFACVRLPLLLRPLLRVLLRALPRVLLRPLERLDPFCDVFLLALVFRRRPFDDLDEPLRLDDVLASGIALLLFEIPFDWLHTRGMQDITGNCR